MLHHRRTETKAVYFVEDVLESHSLRTEAKSAVSSVFVFFQYSLSSVQTPQLSTVTDTLWIDDHPLQSLPVLGRALTRQHVSPQIFITGNRDSVQETVVQLVISSLFLCPHFQLLAPLILEKPTKTISTLQIYQPYLIPPLKVQVKNTHTFPSGSCGGLSPMFGSSCSSW